LTVPVQEISLRDSALAIGGQSGEPLTAQVTTRIKRTIKQAHQNQDFSPILASIANDAQSKTLFGAALSELDTAIQARKKWQREQDSADLDADLRRLFLVVPAGTAIEIARDFS